MATPSKTGSINMLTHALATHPVTILGVERDVSSIFAATFYLQHATVEAAVNTTPKPHIPGATAEGLTSQR